jgi:tRNA dimethylallyltransferase
MMAQSVSCCAMTGNQEIPVLIVAGPTSSGKSALALDIALRFGGSVINADSMQVYRELRLLTARPSAADEARVPHRLYGVVSAAEEFSAARWRDRALAEINAAAGQHRLPVLCGGTGLYIKALTEGLSPIPDIPQSVRRAVRDRFEGAATDAVYQALRAVDAPAAERLPPQDRQRLLRALEVFEATGRSLVSWQQEPAEGPPAGMKFHTIVLEPPRAQLYAACDARFRAMIEAGALAEVAALRALDLDPARPAMKALGMRSLLDHLAGECDLETAVAAAQQATRNYAKRQGTWFRHQIIAQILVNEQYSEKSGDEIFSKICKNWLTLSD